MRDLFLWRLLREGDFTAEEILPLLSELAELQWDQRFPFFGVLPTALDHADAPVRAAAVAALAGAPGVLAFRRIIRGLHDPDSSVRLAAVGALRVSAEKQDPARWAHVIFHPDPAVRRAGVAGGKVKGADLYPCYLMADGECKEALARYLADVRVPTEFFAFVLECATRGSLSHSVARRLILDMHAHIYLHDFLMSAGREISAEITAIISADFKDPEARQAAWSNLTKDDTGRLIELFWGGSPPQNHRSGFVLRRATNSSPSSARSCWGGRMSVKTESPAQSWRLPRGGYWDPAAVRCCVGIQPDVLAYEWVPLETKKEGIEGLYAPLLRIREKPAAYVKGLIERLTMAWQPSGLPDLWVIGGLLNLVRGSEQAAVLEFLGEARIVEAFLEDPVYAAPFLKNIDCGDRTKVRLLAELATERPGCGELPAAVCACAAADHELAFLDSMPVERVIEVFKAMLQLEADHGIRPEEATAIRVTAIVGNKAGRSSPKRFSLFSLRRTRNLASSPLMALLNACLQHPSGRSSTLGCHALRNAITRAVAPRHLVRFVHSLDTSTLRSFLEALRRHGPALLPVHQRLQVFRSLRSHPDEDVRHLALDERANARGQLPAKPAHPVLQDTPEQPVPARLDSKYTELAGALRTLHAARVTGPDVEEPWRNLTYLFLGDSEACRAGVLDFLEEGTACDANARLCAAELLYWKGDASVIPILVSHIFTDRLDILFGDLLERVDGSLILAVIRTLLMANEPAGTEPRLVRRLERQPIDSDVVEAAALWLDNGWGSAHVRDALLRTLKGAGTTIGRSTKLQRLAQVFAWGVRMGRDLTGRKFQLELAEGDELGYTRLTSDKIWVTPLPILRNERGATDIVEALILHEFGHHMYHRGEREQRVWDQASREGLASLLNLVADEHLERNLRALNPVFGDKLKRLNAYAFQHARKEIPVESLLEHAGWDSFRVLSSIRLDAARTRGCVQVGCGRVLQALDNAGSSFARFMRALLMGLGNRHNDPKVGEALALFKGQFRHQDLEGLLRIARRLREIFGDNAKTINSLGLPLDGVLSGDQAELRAHGEGITQAELQAEVQHILEPQSPPRRPPGEERVETPIAQRWINVSPDETFETISDIRTVAHNPDDHAEYATRVRCHARRMRQFLERLGLAMEPQRFRTRGRRLDRSRLVPAMLRGDPRVLIARRLRDKTDLFMGVLVDCSSSMEGGNIEKAKSFAVMLAEAAKGLRGIDLRIFGFTDWCIFEAGTADRCAAHALSASGANNDAAALWHAATVARQSRRRAKLLVMISDGLPTHCSVEALRSLVARLTNRMGICCAQVAVRPLDEICFPHYVLLEEEKPDASVRRFGEVAANLVRRAMHT